MNEKDFPLPTDKIIEDLNSINEKDAEILSNIIDDIKVENDGSNQYGSLSIEDQLIFLSKLSIDQFKDEIDKLKEFKEKKEENHHENIYKSLLTISKINKWMEGRRETLNKLRNDVEKVENQMNNLISTFLSNEEVNDT